MTANFGKFVHTHTGKIIMSVLIGFGLASLFRTACKGNRCRVFRAPPLEDFADKIYKKDEEHTCVQYKPIPTKCSSTNAKQKKIVTFEEHFTLPKLAT